MSRTLDDLTRPGFYMGDQGTPGRVPMAPPVGRPVGSPDCPQASTITTLVEQVNRLSARITALEDTVDGLRDVPITAGIVANEVRRRERGRVYLTMVDHYTGLFRTLMPLDTEDRIVVARARELAGEAVRQVFGDWEGGGGGPGDVTAAEVMAAGVRVDAAAQEAEGNGIPF